MTLRDTYFACLALEHYYRMRISLSILENDKFAGYNPQQRPMYGKWSYKIKFTTKWEIVCSKTHKDHKISGVGSRYSTCQTADDSSSTWILHGVGLS